MKENKSPMEPPLSKIRENPNNPRSVIDSVDDLKASIRNSGLLRHGFPRGFRESLQQRAWRRLDARRKQGGRMIDYKILLVGIAFGYIIALIITHKK